MNFYSDKKIIIAILGIGNIGNRHLESLLKTNKSLDIYIYDIDKERIKNYIKKIKSDNQLVRIFGIYSIEDLPKEITLCIMATPAINRFSTLMTIKSNIRFLILEKVLSSSRKELKMFEEISLKYEKVFVNMPYYFQNVFKIIRNIVDNPQEIIFKGNEFGIACNLVHFIDISEKLLLKEVSILSQESSNLNWKESKRKGFYELTGNIKLKLISGENICLKSEPYFDKNFDTNMQIIVKSAREKIIYEWTTGDLSKNGYKISNNLIPFQSDRTNKILISLLNGEKPEIATLEKAIRIHYILLDVLEPSWHSFVDINENKKLGLNKNNMLIT